MADQSKRKTIFLAAGLLLFSVAMCILFLTGVISSFTSVMNILRGSSERDEISLAASQMPSDIPPAQDTGWVETSQPYSVPVFSTPSATHLQQTRESTTTASPAPLIRPTEIDLRSTQTAPGEPGTIPISGASLEARPTAFSFVPAFAQKLHEQKIIMSDQGNYYRLEDYARYSAETGSYEKTQTGFLLSEFALRADLAWQVAVPQTGEKSGCGFIISDNDDDEHYLVVFTLADRAWIYRKVEGSLLDIGVSNRYEAGNEIAEVQALLVVERKYLRLFVDGVEIYTRQFPLLEPGRLAFTVVSNSSIDYGTYCEMSNIELWEIR